MKKIIVSVLAVFALIEGVCADSAGDIQFKEYVKLSRKNASNPPGTNIVADNKYRILYISMPIAINKSSLTPALLNNMKKNVIEALRKEKADCKIIKDLKISLVYTLLTTEKNVLSIPISYQEL